jgi:hypothetical protein
MNPFENMVVRTDLNNFPGCLFFFKGDKFMFEISVSLDSAIWVTRYAHSISADLESFFGPNHGLYEVSNVYHSLIQQHFEIKNNGENNYTRKDIQ